MTALNARLNAIDNVRCVQADFLEPLRESAFDLITVNPPYIISPESGHIYRDSPGDALCRRLVQTAARHLRTGGYCQILCHWAHVDGETWQDRVASWCAGTGCDAWAMQTDVYDSSAYVAEWCDAVDDEFRAAAATRWLRSMEQLGIDAVGSGFVTLRRAERARTWMRTTEGAEPLAGPCGEHVLRVFTGQNFLEEHQEDARLLDARLFVVPEARLDQFHAPGRSAWRLVGARLRLTTGISAPAPVDPAVAELVGRCDGHRSIGRILAELAGDAGGAPDLVASAIPAARLLIENGFVEACPPSS